MMFIARLKDAPSRRAWVVMLHAMALGAMSHADEVQLMDGGRLSGEVMRMQEGGGLELQSPLASEPLTLIGQHVRKVIFAHSIDPPPLKSNAQLHLANGDFITASLQSYSPADGVRIMADGMGEMEIPAHHLRAIHLGVSPARMIYEGPDALANWTSDSRRRTQNWRLTGDRLTVDGTGQIGRMLELPDHYVIRFNLSWQGQPNFQLGFSDPLEEQEVRVDRYFLQFARAGIEIKRESATGRRFHTIGILNRTPEQFRNRSIEIELRIDRAESVIHLSINGQPEGRFIDPFENPPTAGGISLVSNASSGNIHEIRNLKVESWSNDAGQSSRVQARSDDTTRDALVIRQGDHYSGTLDSIRRQGDKLVFIMKVDFREEPMEILGEDVAMVHFASTADTEDLQSTDAVADLVLQLHDRGSLQVLRSSFEGARVSALHPLLGELSLPRVHVSALERKTPEAPSDDS